MASKNDPHDIVEVATEVESVSHPLFNPMTLDRGDLSSTATLRIVAGAVPNERGVSRIFLPFNQHADEGLPESRRVIMFFTADGRYCGRKKVLDALSQFDAAPSAPSAPSATVVVEQRRDSRARCERAGGKCVGPAAIAVNPTAPCPTGMRRVDDVTLVGESPESTPACLGIPFGEEACCIP